MFVHFALKVLEYKLLEEDLPVASWTAQTNKSFRMGPFASRLKL